MNVVDENFPEDQRLDLRRRRVAVRAIGEEFGRTGMKDTEIIPLLHQLDRPTFFTLDLDFYERRLCHLRYCLVHLNIDEEFAAEFVMRILRHSKLDSKAKRMGTVIQASPAGITVWHRHQQQETRLSWDA